jgi:hypothetical protein
MNHQTFYVMKNITHRWILILLPAILLMIVSCDDYLDPAKDGSLSQADVWASTRRSFGLLNNAYNNLSGNYNRISEAMLAAGCDEAVHADPLSVVKGFNDGTWSKYNLVENVWDNNYAGIRKVNLFLENTHRITLPKRDTTATGVDEAMLRTIERMKGEARFLRAWFYFELVKRYGGVPLIDRTLTADEAALVERQSTDSCFRFIFNDCDSAVHRLPAAYTGGIAGFNDAKDAGRATSWAAKALKARAQLYYASPLFNPAGDKSRWQQAYLTAQDILRNGPFGLHTFGTTGNMTNLFVVNSTMGLYHKEIIFSTSYSADVTNERLNAPISYGGRGLTCPTQNLVDAFTMRNGRAITAGNSGYDPANPFNNRDPRLNMTVLKNGDLLNINDRSLAIETYTGGKDAPESDPGASKTGYYLAKFVVQAAASTTPAAVWDGRTVNTNKTRILIRLPEICYIFAEAYNEYHSAPNNDVYIRLESILKRSGLSLPGGALPNMTQSAMREFIRNERRVELAFEEHRFFDIRRWRLLDDPVEREKYLAIRGLRITKAAAGALSYNPITVQQRIWDDRMYFYPIPQSEIIRSKRLTQNPGW